MRTKLCDEHHHHSALYVISICHIGSLKVQIWDPVVVGPRSNGLLVIGLCPSYPLFKTQLKCSSPLFRVNQGSVSDRKLALLGTGGTKMDGVLLTAGRAHTAADAATVAANVPTRDLPHSCHLSWSLKTCRWSHLLWLLLQLNSLLLFVQTLYILYHYFFYCENWWHSI